MPARRALTASQVASLKDEGVHWIAPSLYLQIRPQGTRSRLFRYTRNSENQWMGLGALAEKPLSEARDEAAMLRVAVKRSAGLVRAGGTLVSIVGPAEARPTDGLAIDFVVEANRGQLTEIVERVRDGRLRTNIGNISSLDDAVAAFSPIERRTGKTIIRLPA